MEDKPLSPKWFIQAMALLAVAGMTIPLVAGVAGFLKDEIMNPSSLEKESNEVGYNSHSSFTSNPSRSRDQGAESG